MAEQVTGDHVPPYPGAKMGWYPDPNDTSRERWWGGTQWTESYRSALGVAG